MERKLRIAVTSRTLTKFNENVTMRNAPYVPRDLITILGKLDVIPFVLPDVEGACGRDYVDMADALFLPGGQDVDPVFFGEEPTWKIGAADYKMDRFEIELVRAFYRAGKPIAGICRGIQVLNVALGGTLYQDLQADNPDAYIRHSQAADGSYPTHHVTVEPGSRLHAALGDTAFVNSRHHQSIRKLAPGLKVTAVAPDGVIEGVESAEGDQVVAVQWHPENMWQEHPEMRQLFVNFVKRVQKYVESEKNRL
jgi:putative glutamine amidotransferase